MEENNNLTPQTPEMTPAPAEAPAPVPASAEVSAVPAVPAAPVQTVSAPVPAPAPAPVAKAVQPAHTFAIVAFVLSIVAAAGSLSVLSDGDFGLSFAEGVAALVFAILARSKGNREIFSRVGMILSIVALSVMMFVGIIGAIVSLTGVFGHLFGNVQDFLPDLADRLRDEFVASLFAG